MNSKYFLFLSLVVLFSACSSQKTISTKWQEDSTKSSSETPRTAYQYNSEYKLFYLFTNDKDHLYINLKVDDQNVQKRILLSGFTIWIDSSAKAKKYMGLKYHVDPNKMIMKPQELQNYLPLDENGKKMSLTTYIIKNMIQEPLGFNQINEDIHFSFNNDSERSLNFQLKLPISYFSNQANAKPIISLILESKAPTNMNQRPQGGSPQMGMSNGGGRSGGGHSGSGHGGRGGGRSGGSERVDGQAQKNKIKDMKIEVKKLQLTSHE